MTGEAVAAEALAALTIDDVASRAFSDALVEMLAGESYFGITKALDSESPNPDHRAIARLVTRRAARAIVTTNFDTLIERALAEEVVRFRRLAGTVDYLAPHRPGCPLYKIHGPAGEDRTVNDTVGQKLRGLPSFVRAELKRLFAKYRSPAFRVPDQVWANDALLQPDSRAAFRRLLGQGWTDAIRTLHPSEPMYTF